MAKKKSSKTKTAVAEAPKAETPKPTESPAKITKPTESPYQLDKTQVHKAARALLKHIESTKSAPSKPNLLEDEDDPTETAQTIWLVVTTKKFITDSKKMKPTQIRLPTPLINPEKIEACLIVKDPQRTYKDLIAEAGLSSAVTRVIGVSKLAKKYKSFEQRRQLEGSHGIFLADDRVVLKLPKILGKTFLKKTSKIPIPVALAGKEKDEPKKAAGIKAEVEKALSSTYLYSSPAPSSNVRVALSTFTPEQVVENVEQAIKVLTEKKIVKGWRGVRSLHIKTSESAALPIWMAPTLYEEEDILKPEEEQKRALVRAEKVAERLEAKKERKKEKKKRKSLSEGANANEVEIDGENAAKRQKVSE